MIQTISVDMVENTFNENHVTELMQEKHRLELELEHCAAVAPKREHAQSRVDEIGTIMDALKKPPDDLWRSAHTLDPGVRRGRVQGTDQSGVSGRTGSKTNDYISTSDLNFKYLGIWANHL